VSVLVYVPKKIAEEIVKRGLSLEDVVLETLAKLAKLDPRVVVEARVELAEKYLDEGVKLVDKDPIQASEKLYKAAEECVKALTLYLSLEDILKRVDERGRWSVTELEKAVLEISKKLGEWFRKAWDSAWVLHVWGFHEAKLDSEDVKARLQDLKELVEKTSSAIHAGIR